MILYEWIGSDGLHYRMATGKHAQHPLGEGQSYELQVSKDRHFWVTQEDYNLGVRLPNRTEGTDA